MAIVSADNKIKDIFKSLGLPAGDYSLSVFEDKKQVNINGEASDGVCSCEIDLNIFFGTEYKSDLSVSNCRSSRKDDLDYFCSTVGSDVIRSRMSVQHETKSKRIFSQVLENEKMAVVLIDAFDYPDGTSINQNVEEKNIAKVLAEANRQNVPVFEIITENDFNEDTSLDYAKFRTGGWTKIIKTENNAFVNTTFLEDLERRGITSIIVMGFNQLYCVKATVESALEHGFKVYTSFDVIQGTIDYSSAKNGIKEHGFESAEFFYNENTTLVDDYSKLPIMVSK